MLDTTQHMLTEFPWMIAYFTDMYGSINIDIISIAAFEISEQFVARNTGSDRHQIPALSTENRMPQPVLQTEQQKIDTYQHYRIPGFEPMLRERPTPCMPRSTRIMIEDQQQ